MKNEKKVMPKGIRKQIILGGLLAFSLGLNAQWLPVAALPNQPIDRTGLVAIGKATPPVFQLEVQTNVPNDGIYLWDNTGGDPSVWIDNQNGSGKNWRFQSFNNGVLQVSDFAQTALFSLDGVNGYCGIGTLAPSKKLEIVLPAAGDVAQITETSGSGNSELVFGATTAGGDDWTLSSFGSGSGFAGDFQIANVAASNRLFLQGSTGRVGIGLTGPANKLHVETGTTNDGIKITQTGNTRTGALHIENLGAGGATWSMYSNNNGCTPSGPHFVLGQSGGAGPARPFIVDGNTGNIGVNITPATNVKLWVDETAGGSAIGAGTFDFKTNATAGGTGLKATATHISGAPISQANVGVDAIATCASMNGTNAHGVKGKANNANKNYGGYFEGSGSTGGAGTNIGVYGTLINGAAGAGGINAGVFGSDAANGGATYAAYFSGFVYVNGPITSSGTGTFGSDRKLKKDIRPLVSALDKLKVIKPREYKFRTDEFKGMYLPSGDQMGVIAQELEEVLPNLVSDVKSHTLPSTDGKPEVVIPDYKSVNYIGLIPLLIASVQEQQVKIESLEQQLSNSQNKQLQDIQQLTNASAQGYSMETNIPNPFTHETTIAYTLPSEVTNAYLAVYDLTGKQLRTFQLQDRGSSKITITAQNLAAGIYFYSIVADDKLVDSKRMLVADK